ncbi:LysE family translocator [Egicoccus sp. AB-alg2]|uniref:LysE family translocator n=1 Tax=Egicoccus sp. AB-alg2 TaxID=3242693 RepID=UPI00359DDD0C
MPAPELLPTFLLATALVCAAPGPDLAFVVASGIAGGPRAGVLAALGMSGGMLVHTTLAALGLAALLRTAPVLLDGVRLLGAGYLLWLAAVTLRAARHAGIPERGPDGAGAILRRAFVTNLANVKVVLFFAAFLPQFVRPDRGSPTLQFVVLGLLFLVVGLSIDVTAGLAAGRIRASLARGSRLPVVLDVGAALVFASIAAFLLVEVLHV